MIKFNVNCVLIILLILIIFILLNRKQHFDITNTDGITTNKITMGNIVLTNDDGKLKIETIDDSNPGIKIGEYQIYQDNDLRGAGPTKPVNGSLAGTQKTNVKSLYFENTTLPENSGWWMGHSKQQKTKPRWYDNLHFSPMSSRDYGSNALGQMLYRIDDIFTGNAPDNDITQASTGNISVLGDLIDG